MTSWIKRLLAVGAAVLALGSVTMAVSSSAYADVANQQLPLLQLLLLPLLLQHQLSQLLFQIREIQHGC